MKERGKGHIINVTSDSERVPFAGVSVYTGKKNLKENVTFICVKAWIVSIILSSSLLKTRMCASQNTRTHLQI